jgi:hypothetical protein
MLSKTRTTIITLIAASSFAGASMAPAVAQATKNTGAYKKSSEAIKAQQPKNRCADLKLTFENYITLAEIEGKNGNVDNAVKDVEAAQDQHQRAENIGCGWAAQVALPGQPPVPVTSGHVTALS